VCLQQKLVGAALFVWLTLSACLPALALDVPPLQGRVNDYAGLLSPATRGQLELVLTSLEASDSTQIVVLTIESLTGDSLEDFSLRVVEQWKIGQQGLDNGVLLLISRDDRKIRIEVGYGLEGKLTDLTAGRIIRNIISPHFSQGNFDQGVIDGVGAIVAAVRGQFSAEDIPQTAADKPDVGGLLTMMICFFFFFGSMFRRSKILASAIGATVSPVIALLFFGITGIALLALIPIGALGGFVASTLAGSAGGAGRGGGFYPSGHGGGFGRSSGGFGGGGFGGGGGGFGGGGASGGW